MPRVKNASPKKPSKKIVKKIIGQKEDATLYRAFTSSLLSLESFWHKRSANLKKQCDTLKARHDKALQKQKAAKAKSKRPSTLKTNNSIDLQNELKQIKEALSQAKLYASKYANLLKMVKQFEVEWSKKQGESNKLEHLSPKKNTTTKKSPARKTKTASPSVSLVEESPQISDTQSEEGNRKTKKGHRSKVKEEVITPIEAPALIDDEILEEILETAAEEELLLPLENFDYDSEPRMEEPFEGEDLYN